jgi:DNA processing protein
MVRAGARHRRRSRAGEGGAQIGHGGQAALTWPPAFVGTRSDRASLMVLMSLATITARALLELAASNPTATACLDAVRRGEAGSPADRRKATILEPDAIAAALASVGGRVVAVGDAEYPARLMELADPPGCLFVRGRALELGAVRPVAIVGSRTCSPAGLEMAAALGSALGEAGSCVVSGAALGIDAAAHTGALHAGGPTVAVLGCGIDVVYPRSNRELFERLADGGTVLSEYPPGTPPEPFRFPARNRIVAGLASAVVVVEGANGSGSMITAELALDIGRDVLAVPGPVTSDLSDVPHQLIRDGATLIRGPEDLLTDLGIETPSTGNDHAARLGSVPKELRLDAGRTLAAIAGRTAPDDLATGLGLPLTRVSGLLMELELAGLVRSVGGRYERTLDRRRTGADRRPC